MERKQQRNKFSVLHDVLSKRHFVLGCISLDKALEIIPTSYITALPIKSEPRHFNYYIMNLLSTTTHNTSSKPLTDSSKPVVGSSQFIHKQSVHPCTLNLRLSNGKYCGIPRSADRTLQYNTILISSTIDDGKCTRAGRPIQTILVEAMFAQEMDGRQIQCVRTGRAAGRVERLGFR